MDNTERVRNTDVVPAPVLVVAAIASVQSGAAVAIKLFPAVGAGGAVLLRLAIAAVILCGVVRPPVRAFSRTDLGLTVGFGVVLAAMNASFYLALDRIPLGVAVTIEFLGPLAVAIGGSRRMVDGVWVVLAAAGVVLLGGGGGQLSATGVVCAAVAAVCWAGYILLSQRVGQVVPGLSGLAVALVVGAVLTAPYGLVAGGKALTRPAVLGKGLAVALLSSVVPYSLELLALRRMRAAIFGVLMSLEPAMAALSGLVFLGQHLRDREWLALGCVVIASVGATAAARTRLPAEMIEG
ncbi:MAG TPA: EamA family transporter [Mycobacteriales bacterium]|nr:EamA family transporter [Mycobacteriales bacterium]